MMNIRLSVNHGRQIPAVADRRLFQRRPFRVVAGVDWSADSLAAVRAIPALYMPDELVLVHAVSPSVLESRIRSDRVRNRARLSEYLNRRNIEFIPLIDAERKPLDGRAASKHSLIAVDRSSVRLAYPSNEEESRMRLGDEDRASDSTA